MSIAFSSLAVGPFGTNCYLLWDPASRAAAIVDPGGDRDEIVAAVKSEGLTVERIILTHGHPDHCFCAGDLARHCGVPIGMHELDVSLLGDSLGIAAMYYDMSEFVPFDPADLLCDGSVVRVGGVEITVLHTPGHSPGGLCFVSGADAFCGDTIFAGSVGRTDLPGGRNVQLIESIRTKILTLDDSTALHPGHGPSTTVGAERASNPFLQ